jgi:hypothetical protein
MRSLPVFAPHRRAVSASFRAQSLTVIPEQRRAPGLYRISAQTYDGNSEGGLPLDDYSPKAECDLRYRSYLHMSTEPPVTHRASLITLSYPVWILKRPRRRAISGTHGGHVSTIRAGLDQYSFSARPFLIPSFPPTLLYARPNRLAKRAKLTPLILERQHTNYHPTIPKRPPFSTLSRMRTPTGPPTQVRPNHLENLKFSLIKRFEHLKPALITPHLSHPYFTPHDPFNTRHR